AVPAGAAPPKKERSGCCVCGLIVVGMLAILLGLAGLAYWQGWLDKFIDSLTSKVGTPMSELKAQGRSPIEVTKCQYNAISSNVGIPNFTIAFRNISHCKVKMI
ncbi:MAG: hypothetical protein N3A66_03955, partial [Planctomycetota bacterium]|nr:hypothetical protein [Planctomycetota bacterium]